MKRRAIARAAAALALCTAAAAQAQSIVNIQGYGDAGSGAGVSTSYPVAPGTLLDLINPVIVSLAAGDYTLSSAWGQPGALYDTWNFESGAPGSWVSHFLAAEVLPDGRYRALIDGVSLLDPSCHNHFCAWDTQAQATAAFLATPAFLLHLAADTQVAFVSADYYLPDNLGGISLQVTPVPEPAGALLLLAGLGGVVAARSRRAS